MDKKEELGIVTIQEAIHTIFEYIENRPEPPERTLEELVKEDERQAAEDKKNGVTIYDMMKRTKDYITIKIDPKTRTLKC